MKLSIDMNRHFDGIEVHSSCVKTVCIDQPVGVNGIEFLLISFSS